jgi:predicted acylesterase/phospholipase RssA
MSHEYSRHSKTANKPDKQRALVLQGGGALGAYEVGVLKVLCKKLLESRERSDEEEGRPLFDIIAGTSMGAMNAAVLVSNVVNRNKKNFWIDEKNGLSSAPDISKWLNDAEKQKK